LIDGFGPVPVRVPASLDELGECVRTAAGLGQAIYPLGGRTQLTRGLPPSRPGVGIDLSALNQVVDYPARDMTITVEAGIRIQALAQILAGEHQRLPIDVPRADQATLGGSLAANVSGPRRLGNGTLRDYLIGITTINDEGRPTRAGGRVVKNVAGYDLCKLHIGALGTLGIIAQVTLKLRPVPETSACVLVRCSGTALAGLLDLLHESRTRPCCIDVLNSSACRSLSTLGVTSQADTPWLLTVGYEDDGANVSWQVQQLVREFASAQVGQIEARAGAAALPLLEALGELSVQDSARLSFVANLLPSEVARFVQRASQDDVSIQAHAGNGIVRGHLLGEHWTLAAARERIEDFLAAAAAARGNLTISRCPVEWKPSLPIWGRPRGDWPLMRRVKEQLDPRGLFNPGRYIEGR
jgi:glycolate oxidase FAD binding subunit